MAETTINGLYKVGVIDRQSLGRGRMGYFSLGSLVNHRRLLEPIGYLPTAKAEAADDRQPIESAMTA